MRILFVAPGVVTTPGTSPRFAPFQEADLALLRELGHDVRPLLWRGRPVLQVLRAAYRADLVFAWNISDHALFASLTARRLVCAVGGYEFANFPEFRYGNLISRRMRFITKWVWKRADALLYVDPSLEEEATRAFGSPGRAYVVPTGYDSAFWTPDARPREDMVITVAQAPNPERLAIKGVDLFLEVAKANPRTAFHVVGELPPALLSERLGANVVVEGWLDREDLRDLYRRAKVYCQFSLHEGLPNAVCEAMLCGCVPVGTRVNGIPTAIGDAGFLVDRTVAAASEGVRNGLAATERRERARDRIAHSFPIGARRERIQTILDEVVRGAKPT